MTAPPADEVEDEIQLPPLPAVDELNRWQLWGLACAWCAEQLLLVPRLRLGTIHDAEGHAYDLFVCEPCVLRVVKEALADVVTQHAEPTRARDAPSTVTAAHAGVGLAGGPGLRSLSDRDRYGPTRGVVVMPSNTREFDKT